MKVTVLEPVEPLTPQEVSRITEVPVPWLSQHVLCYGVRYV